MLDGPLEGHARGLLFRHAPQQPALLRIGLRLRTGERIGLRLREDRAAVTRGREDGRAVAAARAGDPAHKEDGERHSVRGRTLNFV